MLALPWKAVLLTLSLWLRVLCQCACAMTGKAGLSAEAGSQEARPVAGEGGGGRDTAPASGSPALCERVVCIKELGKLGGITQSFALDFFSVVLLVLDNLRSSVKVVGFFFLMLEVLHMLLRSLVFRYSEKP